MDEYVKMTLDDYKRSVLALDEEDNENKISEMLKHFVKPDSIVPDCESMYDMCCCGRVRQLADTPLVYDMLEEYKKLDDRYYEGASEISIAYAMLNDLESILRPIFDAVNGDRYFALFSEYDHWYVVEKI